LCWISELASHYEVPIGFSDHTTEPTAGAMAVMAGACVVEKHLTYDRSRVGPDHAASADPDQFARYVAAIRLADAMRGSPGKRVLDCERDVRQVSRQSLVAARDIVAGRRIGVDDLTVQRPGTGVPAACLGTLVGVGSESGSPPGRCFSGTCFPMPRKAVERRRRICFVTGTRAEFGLMATTLRAIRDHPRLQLQIVVTGMHLSRAHGRSKASIEAERWKIDRTVPWPEDKHDPSATAKHTGTAMATLCRRFRQLG
jgi:hypothetical protein